MHGSDEIADYYRVLLGALRIDRFEPVRRWHGATTSSTSRSCTAPRSAACSASTAAGAPVHVRLLHVFDFDDGLIRRESAWLDVASLQRQFGRCPMTPHVVEPRELDTIEILGPDDPVRDSRWRALTPARA